MQGQLCALDVGEDSVLQDTLIIDGLQDVRTVLELDFGSNVCDVHYFGELQSRPREQRVFICGGTVAAYFGEGWSMHDVSTGL